LNISDEIIEKLYTEEGYLGFRIVTMEKRFPEYFDHDKDSWQQYTMVKTNSDGLTYSEPCGYKTDLAAINHITRLLPEEESSIKRFML
jgi:hypothetical protein